MKADDFNIGRLRQRVSIQAPKDTPTGFGTETKVKYSTVATRWAEVLPVKGVEREWGGQQNESVSHVVRMWYFAGLTMRHRLIYRGRVLAISSVVDEDERRRSHTLLCSELVGEAP